MDALLIYFSTPINVYFLILISFSTASIIIIGRDIKPIRNYVLKFKNINMNSMLLKYTRSLENNLSRVLSDDDIYSFTEIIWVKLDNKLVDINLNYVKIFRDYTYEQIISNNTNLISAEEEVILNKNPTQLKKIIRGKQVLLEIIKIKKENYVIFKAKNITSTNDLEQLFIKQNETNLQLMNQLTNPLIIYDQNKSPIFFNSSFKSFFSLDDDTLGKKPNESEILEILRQKKLLPYQANFREWKKQQLNIYNTLENREQWWYLQDGRTLRVISQANPMGGVTHIYENYTDKLALENETALLLSIQEQTINSLSEGIILFGTNGKVKLHNHQFNKIFKIVDNIQDLHIEKLLEEILKKDPSSKFNDILINVVSSGVNRKDHSNIMEFNKNILHYQSSILPDRSILYTFTDITASQNIENALIEKNKALSEADYIKTNFLNNISHELRAPLQNIIGFSDILEARLSNINKDQNIIDYINDIKRSGRELHHQINQILELTDLESNGLKHNQIGYSADNLSELLQSELNKLNFLDKKFIIKIHKDYKDEAAKKNSINSGFFKVFNQLIKIIDKNLVMDGDSEYEIIMSKITDHEFDQYIFNISYTEPINSKHIQSYLVMDDIYSPGSIEKTILEKYSQILGYQIDLSSEFNEFKIKVPIVAHES